MKEEIFNQYVEKVLQLFNIDRNLIFSKSKKREIVDARQMLYYLCYKRPMQLTYIQSFMNKNGYKIPHSTISHGILAMEKRVSEDRDYYNVVNDIQKSVRI